MAEIFSYSLLINNNRVISTGGLFGDHTVFYKLNCRAINCTKGVTNLIVFPNLSLYSESTQ